MTARELDERVPVPRGRPGTRISVRISSGASAVLNGPVKNSAAGIARAPPGPDDAELGVEREHDRGQLGGRVGVGEAAADRAAVADRRVADEPARLGHQRRARADRRGALDRRLPRQRADRQAPSPSRT